MKINFIKIVIILLIITIVRNQQQSAPQNLDFNKVKSIQLVGGTPKIFSIAITSIPQPNSNMYIEIQSVTRGFFQRPSAYIATQGYRLACFDSDNEFIDLCIVPSSQLKQQQIYSLKISCVSDCKLHIFAYINKEIDISLNQELNFKINQYIQAGQVITLNIPQNAQYTQLAIEVSILNFMDDKVGLALAVSYGSKTSIYTPSLQKYQKKGQRLWGYSLGVFLSKREVNPGDVIKAFVIAEKGSLINYRIYTRNQNTMPILINQAISDYVEENQERIYVLNITKQKQKYSDKKIDVLVTTYSGKLKQLDFSFSNQFNGSTLIKSEYVLGKINYPISPQFREDNNFTGVIYIKATSIGATAFTVRVRSQNNDIQSLEKQVTQIDQVVKDNVVNYIYEERKTIPSNTTTYNIEYTLNIELLQGSGSIAIRRCKDLQNSDTLKCAIKKFNQVNSLENSQDFKEIDARIQRNENTYQLHFVYNIVKCPPIPQNVPGHSLFICEFQIIFFNDQNVNLSRFALTLISNSQITMLKQGQLERATVSQNAYQFYGFQLPAFEGVKKIMFYITIMQGDCIMTGSQSDMRPKLFQKQQQHKQSVKNMIVWEGTQIRQNYFISVYGYEVSDYLLGVVVQRQDQEGISSIIQLRKSIPGNYTLTQSKQRILFTLKCQKQQEVRVDLVQLEGFVTYKVYPESQMQKQKPNKVCVSSENQLPCIFNSTQETYYIDVKGGINTHSVFSIVYYYSQKADCIEYPMNHPIFLSLKSDSIHCSTFIIRNPKQLLILVTVPTYKLLRRQFRAIVFLGNLQTQIKDRSLRLSKEQVFQSCSIVDTNQLTSCNLQIHFETTSELNFSFTVQQVSKQLILFDGIQQYTEKSELSQQIGAYFTYYLYHNQTEVNEPIKLTLISLTDTSYVIMMKIVNQTSYIKSTKNTSQIFPKYGDKQQQLSKREESSAKISILSFTIDQISKANCSSCVILISVFSQSQTSVNAKFKIELSQTFHDLEFGDTKIGYIEENQLVTYQLNTRNINQSIVTITSIHNEDCFKSYLRDVNANVNIYARQNSLQHIINLPKSNNIYEVSVQGKTQCSYQISFVNSLDSILQVTESVPSTVSISGIKYFIYFHHEHTDFRVVQMIQSGSASIYIHSMSRDKNQTVSISLSEVLDLDLSKYAYKADKFNEFLIQKDSSQFCHRCYYMIAIKGQPTAFLDLVVQYANRSVPLKENRNVKSKISHGQFNKTFSFMSNNDFNITINVIYGGIVLSVINPMNKTVKVQNIASQTSKTFLIQYPPMETNRADLFDDHNKFMIICTNTQAAAFEISISRKSNNTKISEGVPKAISIGQQQAILQFLNTNKQHPFVTITIEVTNVDMLLADVLNFSAEVSYILDGQNKKENQIIANISQVQNSINLQLRSIQGLYTFTIKKSKQIVQTTQNGKFDLSVLLVNQKLIQITPNHQYLFKNESIFEIYASNSAIMVEIFNCRGDLEIRASDKYSLLSTQQKLSDLDSSLIQLEHGNFGGHYVVSTVNLKGEFYIKTRFKKQNKSQENQYLISYYKFSLYNQVPYKEFYFARQSIEFNIHSDGIEFILPKIIQNNNLVDFNQIVQIRYRLFASTNTVQLQEAQQCSIGLQKILFKEQIVSNIDHEQISIVLTNEEIKKIVGDKKIYYVGGNAQVNIVKPYHGYPEFLQYKYQQTQMTDLNSNLSNLQSQGSLSKTNLLEIALFIFVPFLIGAALILFSLRYCIMKMRELHPMQLLQQDPLAQSQEGIHQQAEFQQIK